MNGRGAVELVVASVVLSESMELMSAGILTAPLLTGQQSGLVQRHFDKAIGVDQGVDEIAFSEHGHGRVQVHRL